MRAITVFWVCLILAAILFSLPDLKEHRDSPPDMDPDALIYPELVGHLPDGRQLRRIKVDSGNGPQWFYFINGNQ